MLAHLLAFAAATSTLLAPAGPTLELDPVGSGLLPVHGGVGLVLRLTAPDGPSLEVPRLDPERAKRVSFVVRCADRERIVDRASRPTTSRCGEGTVELRPGGELTADWHLAVDWRAGRTLFDRPGAYSVRAVVRMPDGTRLESNEAHLVVTELTDPQRTALDALRAIPDWTLLHAPRAAASIEEPRTLLERLDTWREEYPDAPWGASLPLLHAYALDGWRKRACLTRNLEEAEVHRTAAIARLEPYVSDDLAPFGSDAARLLASLRAEDEGN